MVDFSDKVVDFAIGLIVMGILIFVVFFPTFNSSAGINNSSTIVVGGAANTWFIPAFIALIFVGLVLLVIQLVRKK